jgi:hypothetical protein
MKMRTFLFQPTLEQRQEGTQQVGDILRHMKAEPHRILRVSAR